MVQTKELSLSSDAPGGRLFMLGNEAIARGAIEAGAQVVASYPGTPSSEIMEALIGAAEDTGMYIEWSVNEKVAFEVAFAASMSGLRAMAVMKHVGVNVAHDPLMTAAYMGVKGGLVLVTADDPSMWSSQNEQDNRYIAIQGYIPVLEPSSGQEAREMTADAFRLSEEFGQMFMLRTVTRLSHARVDVTMDKISAEKRKGQFEKDPTRWVCLPANERDNRVLMLERMAKLKKAVNNLHYNKLDLVKNARLGVIGCGIGYAYAREALQWMGIENEVSLLKIGTPYPMPDELTIKMLNSVERILIVEELEPVVENQVKTLAQEKKIDVSIHGKDVVPLVGELSTRKVAESLAKVLDIELPIDFKKLDMVEKEAEELLPIRPPALCPGCPHRAALYAVNVAAARYKKDFQVEPIKTGDIGCYGLGYNPPLNSDDAAICMGGSFGLANGFAHATRRPVIAHLGDSTFFHSGIAPMINAVYNNARVVMLVLDNSTTGQTGFQPNPCSGSTALGKEAPALRPEDVARACQVPYVEVVDPYEVNRTISIIGQALRFGSPAVVVARQGCKVLQQREMKKTGEKIVTRVIDPAICNDCPLCINALGCSAITLKEGHVVIDATQCAGCGMCAAICPRNAVRKREDK